MSLFPSKLPKNGGIQGVSCLHHSDPPDEPVSPHIIYIVYI